MPPADLLAAANLPFAEELYERFLVDPGSVPEQWRALFAELDDDTPAVGGIEDDDQHAGNGGLAPSFEPRSIFNPPVELPKGMRITQQITVRDPALVAERLPFVRNLSLFTQLSDEQLGPICEILDEVECAAGKAVILAGDVGDSLYIITQGKMRVERGGELIAQVGPGAVVGELALMDKQPRSADVIAITPARLLQLSAEKLTSLLDRHGAIARGLFQLVTERLREANKRQERVDKLVRIYRVRGHAIAELDPLGRGRKSHPELELERYGLDDTALDQPFSIGGAYGAKVMTLRRIIQRLRNTYCRYIGCQFMHIDSVRIQNWLQSKMEDAENKRHLTQDEQVRILSKLTAAELFETFIHKKYLGAKRFSLEGGESIIPLLDMAIEEAAGHGVQHIVIGMAHRGRLNVLANIMGKRPEQIFVEFEDRDAESFISRGDVKYHMGFSSVRRTNVGTEMNLSLTFNPSHLEFVTPVVQGRVRAKQVRYGDKERRRVLGIVIHGDAAFAGQGVVQESLNMSELPGYTVGGTLHIVFNNQIGFTTNPSDSRSSAYATDVAKLLEIPIFHVNGEHPDAVAQVIKVAMDFRDTFQRDVIVDMYCYRRHGHNEGDEPRYTQPLEYKWIDAQPSVRERFTDNVIQLGAITKEQADAIQTKLSAELEEELNRARSSDGKRDEDVEGGVWTSYFGGKERGVDEPDTRVPRDRLSHLLARTTEVREGFSVHPRLRRFLKGRVAMAAGDKALDWGAAEALALAATLTDGMRIRLSGQDAGRGTFTHRHAELHDVETGEVYTPLQHLTPDQAPFEVYNSPLSETSVLGFDWGYSLEWPDGLTFWEAQFGDFANGAQVIIDQFISTAEDKWMRLSGLVMLLPHGFEGQGPEHSSARLERFLTLAAQDNMFVVNLTTPAQLFHCLRRQAMWRYRKPLVIMTPKSLLRHPKAVSQLDELATGRFQKVIGDDEVALDKARRVLLCTGKIYFELHAARAERGIDDIAIVRVEQLYPLPDVELEQVLRPVADGTEVRWIQEEPVNMGSWVFMRFRLGGRLFGRLPFKYRSRPESASPATGSKASHVVEQNAIIDAAFAD